MQGENFVVQIARPISKFSWIQRNSEKADDLIIPKSPNKALRDGIAGDNAGGRAGDTHERRDHRRDSVEDN